MAIVHFEVARKCRAVVASLISAAREIISLSLLSGNTQVSKHNVLLRIIQLQIAFVPTYARYNMGALVSSAHVKLLLIRLVGITMSHAVCGLPDFPEKLLEDPSRAHLWAWLSYHSHVRCWESSS